MLGPPRAPPSGVGPAQPRSQRLQCRRRESAADMLWPYRSPPQRGRLRHISYEARQALRERRWHTFPSHGFIQGMVLYRGPHTMRRRSYLIFVEKESRPPRSPDSPKELQGCKEHSSNRLWSVSGKINGQTAPAGGGSSRPIVMPESCTPAHALPFLRDWYHPAAAALGFSPHTHLLQPCHKAGDGQPPVAPSPQIATF